MFTVTTAAGCPWSAQSEAGWISITSATSGTGPASVTFSVAAWNGPSRSGELTIAGQRVTVTQVTGCGVALAPLAQTVSAGGGSGAFSVATAAGCPWSVQSQAAWIAITSATSGTGPATVTFSVGAWDGPARSGTAQVGEQLFTVRQNSGCRFSISPETYSAPSSGGSGAVGVATAALCEWTATGSDPWITIAGGGNGSGTGTVRFNVAPTTGPARSGTLTIAGRTFTVSQASGCTFGISPTAGRIAHAGGPGSVAVSTSAGCVWAASSSVPWARITSGPGGTGSGNATFLVDHTTTSLPRSGPLLIAGHTFTINQDGAPCLYVLGPQSAEVEAGGGAGIFEVNTAENCPWTAASNDAWVHVTAGRTGSGEGAVNFTVDPNPGPARTGSIVAGGRLFTVSQRAAAP